MSMIFIASLVVLLAAPQATATQTGSAMHSDVYRLVRAAETLTGTWPSQPPLPERDRKRWTVQQRRVSFYYASPPATLAELYRDAPVVFHGRITAVRQDALRDEGHPVVVDSVLADETLKDPQSRVTDTRRVQVFHYAGTAVIDGVQVTVDNEADPVLKQGDEVVLFLKPSTDGSRLFFAYGPGGCFQVQEDHVPAPVRGDQPRR